MCSVPGVSVYSLSVVRSTRDACSQRLLATINGTNSSTSSTSAPYSTPRRVSCNGVVKRRCRRERSMASARPFQVEQQHTGDQPADRAEQEVRQVADVQHAACDRLE